VSRRLATLREGVRRFGATGFVRSAVWGTPAPALSDRAHLEAALGFLCRAHDACGKAGVSAIYQLGQGWDVAYPETSGYLIATFLAAARVLDQPSLRERAMLLGEWELELQAPSGGILSRPGLPQTRVFNTGQVMLGLCSLFDQTQEPRYLEACVRAGEYLLRLQEADGRWERDTYCGARTYHARVDWALLRLAALSSDPRFGRAAERNLAWVARQRTATGWYRACGFHRDQPITHVIAYTLRGVLECAKLLGQPLDEVCVSADAICDQSQAARIAGIPGLLPASFDEQWQSRDRHSCATGNAQLSIVLQRLFQLTGRAHFAQAARSILEAAKRTQTSTGKPVPMEGGVPGSFPLGGSYCAYSWPNWGAKFLADALLMQLDPTLEVAA